MTIAQLECFYTDALHPVFGDQFHIWHDRDDFVTLVLDGQQQDFFFTLYGVRHVRLYWCNECFIFDEHRDSLVSSDTYGEIVYEGSIEAATLPHLIVQLILQLKDCTYLSKQETVTGKTPSGYDTIRQYVIQAETKGPAKNCYQLENILILFRAQE